MPLSTLLHFSEIACVHYVNFIWLAFMVFVIPLQVEKAHSADLLCWLESEQHKSDCNGVDFELPWS